MGCGDERGGEDGGCTNYTDTPLSMCIITINGGERRAERESTGESC